MEDQPYLYRAFTDGHLDLTGEGKSERIHYVAVGHSERWSDPEEKVRAEFYAELIYKYHYPAQRIGIEITVPDRTPKDSADLVVFEDDKRLPPYAVIECKRDGITDAEFDQATEQAFGNGHAHKFRANYVGVVPASRASFSIAATSFRSESVRRIASSIYRSATANPCASSSARATPSTILHRCLRNV
ncbi:MAG: type I restriction enzyme HsdR N-terminal domain-containing protein [Rhodanobacteraceae bacterium]